MTEKQNFFSSRKWNSLTDEKLFKIFCRKSFLDKLFFSLQDSSDPAAIKRRQKSMRIFILFVTQRFYRIQSRSFNCRI